MSWKTAGQGPTAQQTAKPVSLDDLDVGVDRVG
jgi:hypothetical protein